MKHLQLKQSSFRWNEYRVVLIKL